MSEVKLNISSVLLHSLREIIFLENKKPSVDPPATCNIAAYVYSHRNVVYIVQY